METGHANSQPPSMSGFGRPEAIYHEQLNSNGEAISFLDSEDRSWHENPSEQIITMVGNARNFYYYGSGSAIKDQDLSACLRSHNALPSPSVNLRKGSIDLDDNKPLPYHCTATDCTCTRTSKDSLYTELPSPDHIRLLEILPGYGDHIECRVHLTKISEAVNRYEALSYTWSSAPPGFERYSKESDVPAKVLCDGHATEVGNNLFAALKRTRHPSNSRFIWADAICINQTDLAERSMQVQRMGEIFESAARVIIWLQDPDGYFVESGVAYKAFSGVCKIVNSWRSRSPLRDEIPIAAHSPNTGHARELRTGDFLGPDSVEWQPVFKLFESKWFHRVWVIQEAVRAKAAVVYWEDCEIAWCHIGIAAAIMRNNWGRISSSVRPASNSWFGRGRQPPIRSIPPGITNAYFMYRLSGSQSLFERLTFTFHELLKLTRQFGCTDDRDRVYGLLGLPTSDGLSSTLRPDYTRPTQELYLQVATGILSSSSSLSLLSSVQSNRKVCVTDIGRIYDDRGRPIKLEPPKYSKEIEQYGKEREEDYPSWVPQWQFVFHPSLAPPHPHSAFSPSGEMQMLRRANTDNRSLELKGVVLDTITKFDETWRHTFRRGATQAERDKGMHMPPFWREYQDDLDTLLARGTLMQSKLQAISLLLTGGKNWYGFPVEDKSAHFADYAKCLLKEGCLWSIQDGFIFADLGEVDAQEGYETEDGLTRTGLETLGMKGNADRFLDACATAFKNRWYFRTATGLCGIGPQYLQNDDVVCILYGAAVPFVIRPVGDGNYLLVGECYVHGIMAGEVIDQMAAPGSRLKEEWITLV